MKKYRFSILLAFLFLTTSLFAQRPLFRDILPKADVWDNADSENFFKIPELSSKDGELKVHLFINNDTYTFGGDEVTLRSYSYEYEGFKSSNEGPFGPTLRIKPSDRLTMIVHNNLPEGPDHDYLGSISLGDTSLLTPGRVSNDLCTTLVTGTEGRITCGNLDGAWTEVIEEGVEWIIYGKYPCLCPPGLEGSCEKIEIVYYVKKMFNPGSGEEALRVYQEQDHVNHDHNIPHGFNTTNMHTHGFHVSPFQDDIFRTVDPSFSSYYTYDLVDHTPGTMWYHPHVHGSTAIQVASGMSGVIIIEEENIEEFPALARASDPEHERVVMFNQIRYDEEIRELPDFNTMLRSPPPKGTTVNGQVIPFMNIEPGEVQRWRMVHSAYTSLLALYFPPEIEVYQISVDGIMFDKPRKIQSIHMAPGNRSDIVLKVPKDTDPKTINIFSMDYNPQCEYFPSDKDCISMDTTDREALMRLVIGDNPMDMKMPMELPGPGPHHTNIKDREISNLRNPRLTKFQIDPVEYTDEYVYLVNGKAFEADTIHEYLPLGKAEVWKLSAIGNHPYHIHINPFQVTEVYDPTLLGSLRKVDPPIWKDVALVNTNFNLNMRTRYQKYWGDFVLHCHILHHEDQGMMQRIRIQRPKKMRNRLFKLSK